MALQVGTNAYISVAEAETYFADRLDVAAWTDARDDQKAQALVTATSVLDDKTWSGYAVSEEQSLAFPRVGTYFDPKLGSISSLGSDRAMTRIKRATCELAYHLLNNDGLLDNTGSIENLTVGSINLSKVKAAAEVPSVVSNLIKPLLLNKGASTWWRAN